MKKGTRVTVVEPASRRVSRACVTGTFLGPWRLAQVEGQALKVILFDDGEGLTWARGWSNKHVNALRVVAALASS